jgi:hypothetical protein
VIKSFQVGRKVGEAKGKLAVLVKQDEAGRSVKKRGYTGSEGGEEGV